VPHLLIGGVGGGGVARSTNKSSEKKRTKRAARRKKVETGELKARFIHNRAHVNINKKAKN
jgi:hypothetical protein